jgi:uncharacterized protein YndB with AHSA1/START domain
MTLSGKLKVTTSGDREIVMTREFNAPRHLVFEALTTPELVSRWLLGPPGWTMPLCEIDLRVGGGFRYLWRNANGKEFGMHGTYHELARPEHIVHAESFDNMPGEAMVTSKLVEQDGSTTLTITVLSPSKAIRDGHIQSGMEAGASASYDRLEELLASQAAHGVH